MTEANKRTLSRWIHLVFGIPILGYCYSPFAVLPEYAPTVRYVAVPVVIVSGLWMAYGPVARRWTTRRPVGSPLS